MRRAQQMIDVGEGGLGQRAQRLVRDHQHVLAHHLLDRDAADVELAIGRLVGAERKQRRVVVRGDGGGWGDGGVHGQTFALMRYKYHYRCFGQAHQLAALHSRSAKRVVWICSNTIKTQIHHLIGL